MNELTPTYTKAVDLDRRIKVSAQLAQQSLYEVCNGLKEMRDGKLYRELGYQNFEEYCESEVGIKRVQAFRMITIIEKLTADFVSSMKQIGTTKLTLLANLDEEERTEIVQNTDLENTTVKELESRIKTLKAEKEKETETLRHRLGEAEERIEELESRPVEVAVETNSHEVQNLRDAMNRIGREWEEKYTSMEEENFRQRREDSQKHQAEINALRADYEKRLADAEGSPQTDTKAVFKAYLANALDAAKRLLEFTEKNPDKLFKAKTAELFGEILKKNGG